MQRDVVTGPPAVRLLGVAGIELPGHRVVLTSERPHLLLALLACRRDWVRRDELADLFYPGRDLDNARNNLRKVIHLARKIIGEGHIEQQADLLRWRPDSDLERFDAACDQHRPAEAVELFRGPLLQGLDTAWPAEALNWLDAERQRLQSRWHEACLQRLEELASAPEAQQELAHRMLRHDPLDDIALQALVRAQQALGRPEAARAAMAEYTRRIGTEWNLEPSAAVLHLDRALRATGSPALPTLQPVMLGRRHERLAVRERLADPSCRVLTLLGPPGVGKTLFARGLAHELGGAWVELEALAETDAAAVALAVALGLQPDPRQPHWAGLARGLGERQVLVILDNAEALPIAGPLAQLLAACPGLRVIVTSRAPLGLSGEWRLPLDGLPLPDLDERDPVVLRANDAVALFEQRVKPLMPAFDLAAEAADVVQLVHEVEGLPLAIELLAPWRRLMPVHDILLEFSTSLELLDDAKAGEHSVRGAFDRSWRQMAPAAQQALARLALLPGPCDRELVRQVVQAPLPVLAHLTDRSMLRADEQGRFSLHPLIRRCAAPLADEREALPERHARYIAQVLGRNEGLLGERLSHALAAWDWGVAHADAPVLGALAAALDSHLCRRGRWHDGLMRSAAACAALEAQGPQGSDAQRALALCRIFVAHMEHGFGRLDAALAHAATAGAIARHCGLPALESRCADLQGRVLWQRGDYDKAEQAYELALQTARAAANVDAERQAQARLGLVAKSRGDYDTALLRYQSTLNGHRSDGTLHAHLYLPNNLAKLLRLLGRLDEALSLLQEAGGLARSTNNEGTLPFLLTNLALVHEQAGRLEQATDFAERGCESARQCGEPMIEGAARLARARVRARLQRDRSALNDVLAALAIADRMQAMPLRVQALSSAGLVLAACSDSAKGLALVGWAMAQPEFARSEREDALRHLQALGLADHPLDALDPQTPAQVLVHSLPRS